MFYVCISAITPILCHTAPAAGGINVLTLLLFRLHTCQWVLSSRRNAKAKLWNLWALMYGPVMFHFFLFPQLVLAILSQKRKICARFMNMVLNWWKSESDGQSPGGSALVTWSNDMDGGVVKKLITFHIDGKAQAVLISSQIFFTTYMFFMNFY